MRSRFDGQLEKLNQEMILMGTMVETAIEGACEALHDRDVRKARDIMAADPAVDRQERDIESLCLRMLLMQQPVARDLRLVSSALKMITDMERIGDQAADIAEIVGATQSAVSHQLRTLKQARLVKFQRDGKNVIYSLSDNHVYTMLAQGMTHICE